MTEVFIFVGAGLCFLFIFLLRSLWSGPSQEVFRNRSGAEAALAIMDLQLPPPTLAQRIFGPADLEFVSTFCPVIQQQFLRERKGIALVWVAQVRESTRQIMRFYRIAVRTNLALSLEVEIKLAMTYYVFLLGCNLVQSLIWLRGPFVVWSSAERVIAAADRVSLATGQLLSQLDPVLFDRIKESWLRSSQPI